MSLDENKDKDSALTDLDSDAVNRQLAEERARNAFWRSGLCGPCPLSHSPKKEKEPVRSDVLLNTYFFRRRFGL